MQLAGEIAGDRGGQAAGIVCRFESKSGVPILEAKLPPDDLLILCKESGAQIALEIGCDQDGSDRSGNAIAKKMQDFRHAGRGHVGIDASLSDSAMVAVVLSRRGRMLAVRRAGLRNHCKNVCNIIALENGSESWWSAASVPPFVGLSGRDCFSDDSGAWVMDGGGRSRPQG